MNAGLRKAYLSISHVSNTVGAASAKSKKCQKETKTKTKTLTKAKCSIKKAPTEIDTPNHEQEITLKEKVNLMLEEKKAAQIRQKIKENIDNKPKPLIEQLKEFFTGETVRYLPQSNLFKRDIPTPFQQLSTNFDDASDTRLSVTKLLWFSHCELRKIYSLYLNGKFSEFVEGIEHGVVLHRSLEKEAHPTRKICILVKDRKVYVETDKIHKYDNPGFGDISIDKNGINGADQTESVISEVPQTGPRNYPTVISTINPKNTQAFLLLETLERLIVLLRRGSCREVSIHGFYSPKVDKFTIDGYEDGIPINGTIDELKLVSDDHEVLSRLIKHMNASHVPTGSYDDFIKEFSEYVENNDPQIQVNIKEYKSRKSGFKPNRYFVRTHLLQASIYYKLFEQGACDAEVYFQSWISESMGRGLHVYEPLDNDTIALCCLVYPRFLEECIKLKYGIGFNFEKVSFKPPKHPYIFRNTTNRNSLNVLQGTWIYTPTLAHILARVVQVQNLTAPFTGGKVEVEYLNLDRERISEEKADFDNEFMEKGVLQGMDLWLGKRDPKATMNKALCIQCEFNDHCKVGVRRVKLASKGS